jgi:phospholipase C
LKIQRRDFLRTALGATAATAFSSCGSLQSRISAKLPPPEHSGIEHIVVVMMENRSFDHFLGWLPTADGRQAGLSYADQTGAQQQTYNLAGNFTGCGHVPPDHSYEGGRIQCNA